MGIDTLRNTNTFLNAKCVSVSCANVKKCSVAVKYRSEVKKRNKVM